MPFINYKLTIPDEELEFSAVRSQGAGGQNVNKVSTAIQLRWSVTDSSINEEIKALLKRKLVGRINSEGILTLKSQESRSQSQNKEAAVHRFCDLVRQALIVPKKRIPTKATKASKKRRVDKKKERSQIKSFRKRVDY